MRFKEILQDDMPHMCFKLVIHVTNLLAVVYEK